MKFFSSTIIKKFFLLLLKILFKKKGIPWNVPSFFKIYQKNLCCIIYTLYSCEVVKYWFIVDMDGNVCISILHEPGDDRYGYEKPEERWLPVHTVETILLSVISMLADPNYESPANVDAAVRFQTSSLRFFFRVIFIKIVKQPRVCSSTCFIFFHSTVYFSTKYLYNPYKHKADKHGKWKAVNGAWKKTMWLHR